MNRQIGFADGHAKEELPPHSNFDEIQHKDSVFEASREQKKGSSNRMITQPFSQTSTCVCGEGTPPMELFSIQRKKQKVKREFERKAKAESQLRQKRSTRNSTFEEAEGKEDEDRIVNGYEADNRPWMASFGSAETKYIACGGAIINRRFIL